MIIWTPILRIATKLTGWIQQKAATEQLEMATPKLKKKHKVTIVIPSQQPKNSLPPCVNVSKQLGGQVGYPAHSQNARPLGETSPKPDLADGQDVKPQLEPPTRRSQLCLEEAKKNRDEGMPWLAELNEVLACINEHQENTDTRQLQERANKALNKHLELLDKELNG